MLHDILVRAEAVTMQTLLGMTLKGLICRDNIKPAISACHEKTIECHVNTLPEWEDLHIYVIITQKNECGLRLQRSL